MSGARGGLRVDECGGIISGFFIRMVLALAVVALFAFEAGSMIVARVQVDGIAVNAATEAASEYGNSGNVRKAELAAERICNTSNAQLRTFEVSPDGRTVTVTVRKVAHTFIVQHVSGLKRWRIAESTHGVTVT